MKHNVYQGRIILAQGWVEKAQIVEALKLVAKQSSGDLCDFLLKNGQIEQRQASLARAKTEEVLGAPTKEKNTGNPKKTAVLGPQSTDRAPAFQKFPSKNRPRTERLSESDLNDQAPKKPGTAKILDPTLFNSLNESDEQSSESTVELVIPKGKLEQGQDFGDYSLVSELSRGAMGVIFKALHRPTQRVVALKFMLDSAMDETERLRFQREAETLIQLKHPNIVEITDYGRAGNRQFLAMQLIEGKDLHVTVVETARLQSAAPPWEELLPCFVNIADALLYCHQRNVLHRDVKPSNIIIEKTSGQALLVDFGLIKLQSAALSSSEDEAVRLTKTQEIVGTPQFMSPEQFAPKGNFGLIGPKTDVWGFAATMFFALTGQYAFHGRAMVDIYDAVTNKRPPRVRSVNPAVPEWLSQLCADCFGKHVQERPDMEEVSRRLKDGLRELEIARAAPPTPRRVLALRAVIVILAILAALLLLRLLTTSPPPKLLNVECPTHLTQEKSVIVMGWANGGDVPIRVTNKLDGLTLSTITLKSDKQGAFRQKVLLDQGVNTIIVSIDLEESNEPVRQFLVPHDSIPPSLEIDNPQRGGKYILGPDHILRGRVFDAGGIDQFLANGRPLQRNSDGSFILKVDYRSRPKPLRLTSFDLAKNSTDSTIVLVTERDYKRYYKKN